MKIIWYKIMTETNIGTGDKPKIVQGFSDVGLDYSEENVERAKAEAYNGEYTIVDDGRPEPEPPEPTAEEVTWDSMADAITEGVNAV